jgi:DNA polymerase-3 subunit gamma/tau
MLRSRKKQLESGSKKSSDANERQDNNVTANADESATTESLPVSKPVKNEAPAIETVPEQPYSPEIIDPTSIRYANQVDKWANMIDTMALNGRIRQLAIHATISENSNDDLLILNLDQSTKHLKSEAAHQQLQAFISDYLQKPITVEINVVEQTISDPYQIQTDINDKRLDYAISVIKEDEIVQTLQQQYQAELDEKSIVAR